MRRFVCWDKREEAQGIFYNKGLMKKGLPPEKGIRFPRIEVEANNYVEAAKRFVVMKVAEDWDYFQKGFCYIIAVTRTDIKDVGKLITLKGELELVHQFKEVELTNLGMHNALAKEAKDALQEGVEQANYIINEDKKNEEYDEIGLSESQKRAVDRIRRRDRRARLENQ